MNCNNQIPFVPIEEEKLCDFVQEEEQMKSIYEIWKKLIKSINLTI